MRRRGAERIKSFVCNWHKAIARSSWFAWGYLAAVSAISRNIPGLRLAERIGSLLTAKSIDWPEMAFFPGPLSLAHRLRSSLSPILANLTKQSYLRKSWITRRRSGRCRGIDVLSFGGPMSMNGLSPAQEFSEAVHRTYAPAFVATLKDVTLVGSEPLLVASDGRILRESVLNEASFLPSGGFDLVRYPARLSQLLRNLSRQQVFNEPIFPLIRLWSKGYYHWHVESLTALHSYQQYVDVTGLRPKVLVHSDRPKWMQSSLALMGVRNEDLVEWTATYGRADTVVLASLNRAFMAPDPVALRWVSAQMHSHLPVTKPARSNLIPTSISVEPTPVRVRSINSSELLQWPMSLGRYEVYA